ncbi:hypothetical protein [Rossellomorea marisflavi]|uniref:Helix-turn-helix conjugative transposon-like domain-containing protein n=1 Tax=Rossellomorea marisflavi TaxID=189381 RepID=A0A161RVN2_9BACI|nr:hypothetical protein [Rossellomorea marisflavi]KZE50968.1 hypothetical protein AV649_16485 [Rossellomorea marisflavi]
MNSSLYKLVRKAKTDNHSLNKVIELFFPRIFSSLNQTNWQDREDLSQELKIKLLVLIRNYDLESVPCYFQMIENPTNDK